MTLEQDADSQSWHAESVNVRGLDQNRSRARDTKYLNRHGSLVSTPGTWCHHRRYQLQLVVQIRDLVSLATGTNAIDLPSTKVARRRHTHLGIQWSATDDEQSRIETAVSTVGHMRLTEYLCRLKGLAKDPRRTTMTVPEKSSLTLVGTAIDGSAPRMMHPTIIGGQGGLTVEGMRTPGEDGWKHLTS